MAATNDTKFLSYTQYENTLSRLSATTGGSLASKGTGSEAFTARLKSVNGTSVLGEWTHPSATATTIAAADTYVLSSVTVDAFGHVTSVGRKALAAADIPSLSWSKITSGKPTTLSGYGITDAKVESVTNGTKVTLGTGSVTIAAFAVGAAAKIASGALPALYVGRTAVSPTAANRTLLGVDGVTNASSASGDSSLFTWDSENGAWHFSGNLYADGWVSAYGVSGGGSGGGAGVNILRDWQYLDLSDNLQVLGSNLADGLRTRIAALENSSTNVSFTQTLTSGKEIGTITIDGSGKKLYAPGSYALSDITGADDLKAIEAITGTSGVLQKTAANTWSLVAKTDSSSAGAIGTGTGLVTERDVYYGLPKINNAHNYTSSSAYYAPTSGGTAGYILKAKGSTSAPEWDSVANVMAAYATVDALNQAIGGITQMDYTVAWNGSSAPTVADIPSGVKVTYNGTAYTGTKSSGDKGKIYLVHHSHGTGDAYDEYMYFGAWEKIGNTDVDLSGHWLKTDLVAMTATETATLLNTYFPVS